MKRTKLQLPRLSHQNFAYIFDVHYPHIHLIVRQLLHFCYIEAKDCFQAEAEHQDTSVEVLVATEICDAIRDWLFKDMWAPRKRTRPPSRRRQKRVPLERARL